VVVAKRIGNMSDGHVHGVGGARISVGRVDIATERT